MTSQDQNELRQELTRLRTEHRELDAQISELEGATSGDQLLIKRLKKRKLILKDEIIAIEDRLFPDIIA